MATKSVAQIKAAVEYREREKIFLAWNAHKTAIPDMVSCIALTGTLHRQIKLVLKRCSHADLLTAVNNYAQVLKEGLWFGVPLTLGKFLSPGILTLFVPGNFNIENFRSRRKSTGDASIAPAPVEKNPDVPYARIIAYLNHMAGVKFSADDPTTCAMINALWAKGHRGPQFKRVIDNMVARWKNDPERNMYLRPQTLFKLDKFETYLNANPVKKVETDSFGRPLKDLRGVSIHAGAPMETDSSGRPFRYPKGTMLTSAPMREKEDHND